MHAGRHTPVQRHGCRFGSAGPALLPTTIPSYCPPRYRHTSYHKQTKNLWARDDPAFVVLCCALVATTSAVYSLM